MGMFWGIHFFILIQMVKSQNIKHHQTRTRNLRLSTDKKVEKDKGIWDTSKEKNIHGYQKDKEELGEDAGHEGLEP